MIVTCVHVSVKAEYVADFIAATTPNHQGSVNEPGNFRFDILQDASDPTKFLLYEAYRSPEDAAAHKETAHYQAWRAQVAPWMAEPQQGVKYQMLLPESAKS